MRNAPERDPIDVPDVGDRTVDAGERPFPRGMFDTTTAIKKVAANASSAEIHADTRDAKQNEKHSEEEERHNPIPRGGSVIPSGYRNKTLSAFPPLPRFGAL